MEITLNNKTFSITPQKHSIESILIFGSFVRGDSEEKSDIDILIIIDNCSPRKKFLTSLNIANEMDIPSGWISLFTISEFKKLCYTGSHFIWSLKLDGKILYSRNYFLERCFKKLPLYLNMKNDIYLSISRLNNLIFTIKSSKRNYGKEITLLGYLIRNTLMILSYTYGYINFNKYEVMDICSNISDLNIPFSKEDYHLLLSIKQDYKYDPKNYIFPDNIEDFINDWIVTTDLFLNMALSKISMLTSNGFISPIIQYIN